MRCEAPPCTPSTPPFTKFAALAAPCCCAPQILEEQHALFFHLQQQRLIELIRSGKTEEALAFAQEYLAPHGEENEAFLEELGEMGHSFGFFLGGGASGGGALDGVLDEGHCCATRNVVNRFKGMC